MKTRKELKHGEVVWEPNIQEALWSQSKQIDLGQKKVVITETETDILLTEEDMNYFPSQKDLQKYNFFATEKVSKKLFLPFYELRTIKKDKVVKTVQKLTII